MWAATLPKASAPFCWAIHRRSRFYRYETDRKAQQVGTEALVVGARCSEANAKCLGVIRDAGLGDYIRHRQGHGIGLQNHEPPWVEDGDQTVLAPGMAVSCEPGIYCPGQGGYRISDSIVVTRRGAADAHTRPARSQLNCPGGALDRFETG